MVFTFPLRSVFLALPLEGRPKWQFQALQEELKPYEDILRFQNPQSPHLTLMFWPSVGELEYLGIVAQAMKIAAAATAFTLKVTGAETFGSHPSTEARPRLEGSGSSAGARPRVLDGEDSVLFLAVAFSDELARVKKSCPWSDGRVFNPHVTLARIGHPQRFNVVKKKVMKTLDGVSFAIPIDRLRLYAEVNGAKQTELEDFACGTPS